MKKKTFTLVALTIVLTSAFTIIEYINWKVQEDSYTVKFKSKKFDGVFKGLKATIKFDENDLSESAINASIESATASSGNELRDKHTREALDAKDFPLITFESNAITKKENSYEALGKLTIKGVTKDIILPFTFTKTNEGGVFAGKFVVLTKDFNIAKSGSPEEVEVQLTVPVIQ